MREKVKIFTFVSGHGETVIEPRHEELLNRWLAEMPGKLIRVTQSESERSTVGHHVTLCLWYTDESHAQ